MLSFYTLTARVVVSAAAAASPIARRLCRNTFDVSNQNTEENPPEEENGESPGESQKVRLECQCPPRLARFRTIGP